MYDTVLSNDVLESYFRKNGTKGRPLPPRRHNKNVIESKHRIIGYIYLRLKNDTDLSDGNSLWILVQKELRISNDL